MRRYSTGGGLLPYHWQQAKMALPVRISFEACCAEYEVHSDALQAVLEEVSRMSADWYHTFQRYKPFSPGIWG